MAIEFTRFHSAKQAEQALLNEIRHNITAGPGYTELENSPDLGARRATAPFVLMLPGGKTPLRVYDRVAAEPPASVHPALHIVVSDDRHVGPDSPDSNFGRLKPLASALHLPENRLIHPDPSAPIEIAAETFARELRDLDGRKARFGLAILGIGDDGHTAGIFDPNLIPLPADITSRDPDQWAFPVTGRRDFDRVTASASCILRFRRILFFATGAGKRDILYAIARRPEEYPAGRILLQHDRAEIWTDQGFNYE